MQGGGFGPGGGRGGKMRGNFPGFPGFPGGGQNGRAGQDGQNSGAGNGFPGGALPGGSLPGGRTGGQDGGQAGAFPGFPGGTDEGRAGRGGMGGGMGGLLDGAKVPAEVAELLKQDARKYTWVAAAVGSQNQASYQLASGEPVMALGGFNGSDPSLSLDGFKKLVAEGRVHWFIGGGGMGGGMGGSSFSSEIASWVESTYTAKTVGSTTMYDLTAAPKNG